MYRSTVNMQTAFSPFENVKILTGSRSNETNFEFVSGYKLFNDVQYIYIYIKKNEVSLIYKYYYRKNENEFF